MSEIDFYVGVHQPCDAGKVDLACISINRLLTRRGAYPEPRVAELRDSGAFTTVTKHGGYPHPPAAYARQAARWVRPTLRAVVAQDFMCEPFVLAKTGATVALHQRWTVERYDELLAAWGDLCPAGPPIMPVLQGFAVHEYLEHLDAYGDRLTPGMWVGVGSVCKRQGRVEVVEDLLLAIKEVRPDLRLHGFRREADGLAEQDCAALPSQRRQHGLELRGSIRGPGRQQHRRSACVRRPGRVAAYARRATASVVTALSEQGRTEAA